VGAKRGKAPAFRQKQTNRPVHEMRAHLGASPKRMVVLPNRLVVPTRSQTMILGQRVIDLALMKINFNKSLPPFSPAHTGPPVD
jgi:hypothetical protein